MKKLLLEHKGKFILYIIACLFPVIRQLMQIGIISLIFETIERDSMDFFKIVILISVGFLLINALMYVASRLMQISYMRDVLLSLRIKAFDKIIHLNFKEFNKKSRDVYVSNLINDVNTFENSFFVSFINFVFRCGIYVSALIILAFINWMIAIIILIVSIMVLLISRFFEKKTVSLQKDVSLGNEKFTVDVSNVFSGLEILKLNNIEETFLKKNLHQIIDLEGKKFKFNLYTSLQNYSNTTIGYFVLMGLIIFLMYQTQVGLGYGMLMLTIQLTSSAIFPLVNMLPLLNILKSSKAIYEKITTNEVSCRDDDNLLPFEFRGRINVNNVSFSYDDKTVLNSMKFSLEKGKKHLIKGPSGSGKTTLFKLLSHVLDDYTGTIDVDGININLISTKSFNEKVSYIYQDVYLFEASLKDNISLFKPYTDEEVIQACNQAGLEEFLSNLEDGIHTMISENGKNLSGGERQRVSIARALCKKSEILFVDEATSALNDELGEQIEKTLLQLDSTVIAISHKYFEGITNQFDIVFEIKDGQIATYDGEQYFSEVTS